MVIDDVESLLEGSFSPFHVVRKIEDRLISLGYEELDETKPWSLKEERGYFVSRNGSSLVSFYIPKGCRGYFRFSFSHTDSPTYKLKPDPIVKEGGMVLLNTEPYGGMLHYTWLDRPLTIAGRVMVKEGSAIRPRLFAPGRALCSIPSLAIHLNRDANAGLALDPSSDLRPLLALGDVDFKAFLAGELGVGKNDVYGHDLYLSTLEKPRRVGLNGEFLSSPKLDDLASTYTCLLSFTDSSKGRGIPVYGAFDNEEVGSHTRQGAGSTFLKDVLLRICGYLDIPYEEAVAASIALSVDNGHAYHPNRGKDYDPNIRAHLGGGAVVKQCASESYTTNGLGYAYVKAVAEIAGAKTQDFVNKSGVRGGSTLGNISNSQVSVLTADIGLPQLAMHSSVELCASSDIEDLYLLVRGHLQSPYELSKDGLESI